MLWLHVFYALVSASTLQVSYQINLVPYEELAKPDNVANPAFLRMPGWEIARGIHQKYGLRSDQKMLLDYRNVLRRPRQEVDKYLGSPVRTGGGNTIYRAPYGKVTVAYKNSRAVELEVAYSVPFDSYIAVLKSVGITKLVRPMAMNASTLLYNPNFGNSLTPELSFTNVAVYLPDKEETKIGWRILFLSS